MVDAGGFDHNAHTLRLLTCLENPYPDFDGLNLSWETLEGLAKHNGPVAAAAWALAEANADFPLELDSWPSLEAQVAAIADDIAYDNHDIDDGLRAGMLTLDALLELPFVGAPVGGHRTASSWARADAQAQGAGPRRDRPDGRRRARRDPARIAEAASRRSTTSRRRPAAGRFFGGDGGGGAGAEALLYASLYDSER